jgi:hypothetical protein
MPKKGGYPYDSYFKVPNQVFGTQEQLGWIDHVGPVGVLVYLFILRRFNHQKQESIYESHRTVAKRLNISRSSLEMSLLKLQGLGLISRRPVGRRRHTQCQYVPVIPVLDPSKIDKNVSNGPPGKPINTGLAQPAGQNGLVGKPKKIINALEDEVNKSNRTPMEHPKRLSKRLYKNKCVKTHVNEVIKNEESVPLKTQVQVSWQYWCHLWEEHYRRPYYLAKASDNARVISKDKKNLRAKITAVGFREVVARMHRCFDICDDMFPCKAPGKPQEPISFNVFISNHFFDQWIMPVTTSHEHAPKDSAEKVKEAMEKRTKATDGDKKNATDI